MPETTADHIIKQLNLEPHPEGGYFRETFRDTEQVDAQGRAASTAIYFLLKAGQVSRWHTVDAVEIWHHYQGAPLQLDIAPPNGPVKSHILSGDTKPGVHPQLVVPKGHWQQSRSRGEYSLVGCTVAPGFEFSGFKMAPEGFIPGE